jgi:hypothetical protein
MSTSYIDIAHNVMIIILELPSWRIALDILDSSSAKARHTLRDGLDQEQWYNLLCKEDFIFSSILKPYNF